MKILYVHGFGARYNPEHPKVKMLETLGTVKGSEIRYTRGADMAREQLLRELYDVDIAVGNCMGGHAVASWAHEANVPWVAMNPIIKPSKTMQSWIGVHRNNHGDEISLTELVADTYPDIEPAGFGRFIAETGDEVQSASEIAAFIGDEWELDFFKGGSHKFRHMEAALPLIKEHKDAWLNKDIQPA